MTITLMLDDVQARALEEALFSHLRELEVELSRTEDRTMKRELHHDWTHLHEVFDQLSRRRRFLASVLGKARVEPASRTAG